MLQKLNRVAKALLAFGVPAGVLVADLSGQWLNVTADGTNRLLARSTRCCE